MKIEDDWQEKPFPKNIKIGSESSIHSSYVFSHYESKRPLGLKIGHNTGTGVPLFDLGENGELEIGNYCTLVQPIINTNKRIIIGDYALIAAGVIIADSEFAVPPIHKSFSSKINNKKPKISIRIRNNVWISTDSIILEGADIGDNSIIAARTIVNFKVPANSIVLGNPARILAKAKSHT